ncbi:MAG TPA: alpha/beta hydrolase [Gammaproteobacteria bacterium]|nr:alpha/beta hydrolase [Gammaproteobacteria bacterium]
MSTNAEVTWEQVAAQVPASSGERVMYARESPHQFGVLRVPEGDGPHPVVVVIHGGCWLAQFDRRHVEKLAEVLTASGLATWVLEYRRIGNPGGGWPGTFLDIAHGTDHLRDLAADYALDLDRVVVVGHSSGGHLALWLAARPKLAASSDLYSADPLRVSGVVALAGITDLRSYSLGSGTCNAAVRDLMGGMARDLDERYNDANPWDLRPLGVPLRFVHGAIDDIVPATQSRRFVNAESKQNLDVGLEIIRGAGHFDVVAPFAPAWKVVQRQIVELAGLNE